LHGSDSMSLDSTFAKPASASASASIVGEHRQRELFAPDGAQPVAVESERNGGRAALEGKSGLGQASVRRP
jgi:hypothetical protein